MAGKGGYQKPAAPAAASGPGRLARRTDGGPAAQPVRELPNAQYGEAAEFRTLQQSAPLPKTPTASSASGGGAVGGPGLTGFGADSTNPDEPVTAGASLGPGASPEQLGLSDPNDDLRARLWAAYMAFPTEDLRELLENLDDD